tara:strand:- start:931 stop:1989 length:1059 start_codon:yes stop_codon:yes gene_type:complete
MGIGTSAANSADASAHRLLWVDLEGAPSKGVAIWDTAIVHDTGSVRYVRWNTPDQRKRLRRNVPVQLADVITGDKWPQGTVHRIDQDADLQVVAHAVCDDEYEAELADHLKVAQADAAHIIGWSSFDTRTLCNVVLSKEDAKTARAKGLHVDALKRARHYFTVPSFSLSKKTPGSIRHALKARDFGDAPGCGSGPHCALYDALTMREVCRKAVVVLRAETDGNMTMDRFLGLDAAPTPGATPPKHALCDAVSVTAAQAIAQKPVTTMTMSDVDKVFNIRRQVEGAHEAWLVAHKNEHYWDAKGKLHAATSRDFKQRVRKIMGPAWCTENGHRLNATRTKDGVLRLLARAANA